MDERDPHLARVEKLARWLDDRGLDPLLGLILPGVGDIAGILIGLYAIGIALKNKLPAIIVARMLLNLGVDALFGIVPLVGDVFDLGFKANKRNLALLRAHAAGRSTWRDWLAVGAAVLFLVGAVFAASYGVIWLIRSLKSC